MSMKMYISAGGMPCFHTFRTKSYHQIPHERKDCLIPLFCLAYKMGVEIKRRVHVGLGSLIMNYLLVILATSFN